MPLTSQDILYGGVTPVIVACSVLLLVRHFTAADIGNRYAAALAHLAGFLVGYGWLSLGPWAATAHWHWLPYVMIAATIAGPIATASGVRSFEGPLLYVVMTLVAGWLLVPSWDDLAPSRTVHLTVLVVGVVVLAGLLEPLAQRRPGPLLPTILWATMTVAAVVLALSGSLRFAQIGLASASALFGIVLVACFTRNENHLAGFGFVFATAAVGLMLIGRVNSFSNVPLISYVLVPIAPLTLWCGAAGPLSCMTGFKGMVARASLPIGVLTAALIFGSAGGYEQQR